MEIAVFSDLHNEFTEWQPSPEALSADVVVLAGDIHLHKQVIAWILKNFSQPVVFVLGNHEYYSGNIKSINKKLSAATAGTNIHLLNNGCVTIGGIEFIGTTLWTDFKLFNNAEISAMKAQSKMVDYKYIRYGQGGRYRKLTPGDTKRFFAEGKSYLSNTLDKSVASKRVVITHHAPSITSIAPELRDDLSAAYASNLDAFINSQDIDLWVHGHTHHNVDYYIGKTRVLSNQRGYVPEESVDNFNSSLCIEL